MPSRRKPPPQDRSAWGQYAEDIAAHSLERQGQTILARNVHHRSGEIDLVCRRGACLTFVEVRSLHNTDPARAIASIDHRKRRKIQTAARAYLAKHPPHEIEDIFFLCVGISFQADGSIRLLQQFMEFF